MSKRIAASVFMFLIITCTWSAKQGTTTVSVASLANATAAMIDGRVTTGGNPLPGATVTLTGPFSGARTVVSDVNGVYHFTNLIAGNYIVRVELEGLQVQVRSINVPSQTSVRVTSDLKTSVAEAITVTASAPENAPGTFTMPNIDGAPAYTPRYVESTTVTAQAPPVLVTTSVATSVLGAAITELDPSQVGPQYAPFADHTFVAVKDEPVTTFSIDVDRASYANVRRFLAANQLPPPDAVRVEEMINYFPYHYPQPSDGTPFSVTTEVAGCPWELTHRLLRIGIQGKMIEQWKMAPNNLVFLIDVSGSMMPPERLPLIKSAFRLLVEQLRAEDEVSIVTYAGAAGLALPRTSGADKQAILGALDRLESGGSTNGGEGIQLAYQIARDNFLPNGNNRVILATDGDFNVGISSMKDLTDLIEKARSQHIFLTALGVGDDNFKDATMEMLADKGNGFYAYLDTMKEAEKVFVKELTGSLVTIAKDVKVQLVFDPARVASYRQIGYEDRALANKDFEDDTKDAGELGSGHGVTALYEIVPTPAAPVSGQIATLKLRWKEPQSETSRPIELPIADDGKSVYQSSTDLQFAAAIAEFGMLLRKSPHKGTATFADVIALARASHGDDLDGYRDEFVRMAETSRALSAEAPPAIAVNTVK
jgi:Ca-activated chloride channel family protein